MQRKARTESQITMIGVLLANVQFVVIYYGSLQASRKLHNGEQLMSRRVDLQQCLRLSFSPRFVSTTRRVEDDCSTDLVKMSRA